MKLHAISARNDLLTYLLRTRKSFHLLAHSQTPTVGRTMNSVWASQKSSGNPSAGVMAAASPGLHQQVAGVRRWACKRIRHPNQHPNRQAKCPPQENLVWKNLILQFVIKAQQIPTTGRREINSSWLTCVFLHLLHFVKTKDWDRVCFLHEATASIRGSLTLRASSLGLMMWCVRILDCVWAVKRHERKNGNFLFGTHTHTEQELNVENNSYFWERPLLLKARKRAG